MAACSPLFLVAPKTIPFPFFGNGCFRDFRKRQKVLFLVACFRCNQKQELSGVIMGVMGQSERLFLAHYRDPKTLFLISAAERRRNHLSDSELPKLRPCIGPLSVQQTLVPTGEYYRFNATDDSYLTTNYILILSYQ